MLGCKMKISLGLLLVLALMGCTAAYGIPAGFENVMTEEMVPSGERYMFGGVQATNRDFMSPKPSIQDCKHYCICNLINTGAATVY